MFLVAMVAMVACATDDGAATSCTTTLLGERRYEGAYVIGEVNPRTEIYAAAVTERVIDGSACDAEDALNESEPPMAWSHACGCERTAPQLTQWEAALQLAEAFCSGAGECATARARKSCPDGACTAVVTDTQRLDLCLAIAAPLRDTTAICAPLFR